MIYLFVFIVFVGLVVYAFYLMKPKALKQFPKHWHKLLLDNVLFYKKLSAKNQAVFRQRMLLFLSEVNIDAVNTTIEDIDKVLLASSAIIPVFGFKEWSYNNLSGIIVYLDKFNADLQFSNQDKDKKILGMVGTGRFDKQMILSQKAIRHAFLNKTDKHNTPIHEFVHLLDKMDGDTDGIPEYFLGKAYIQPWLTLMHKEMEAINNDQSDIRKYGGTSQAEFFAVASEYFFERPKLFKQKHPELFNMLSMCFQQSKAVKN